MNAIYVFYLSLKTIAQFETPLNLKVLMNIGGYVFKLHNPLSQTLECVRSNNEPFPAYHGSSELDIEIPSESILV